MGYLRATSCKEWAALRYSGRLGTWLSRQPSWGSLGVASEVEGLHFVGGSEELPI